MSMTRKACALVLVLVGCGGDGGGRGLRVGMNGPEGGGNAGVAGIDNPSGGASGGLDVMEHALAVEVQHESLAVELVTLRCAGECAEVEAVATGGHPPYTFAWDDGPTDAMRMLCSDATTTFGVAVTDTGIDTEELSYAARTERAEVTAAVLSCSDDGGVPEAELCLENPSIEGTPGLPLLTPFDALGWDACVDLAGLHTGIADETTAQGGVVIYPAPADGESYGTISQDSGFGGRGVLAQTLCAPIPAGAEVSFEVSLARDPVDTPNGPSLVRAEMAVLEVRGGSTLCSEEQSLWRSPPLVPEWARYCVTFAPEQPIETLSFNVWGDGGELFLGAATLMIDNIRPVSGCP
jgi:hypothetical protein